MRYLPTRSKWRRADSPESPARLSGGWPNPRFDATEAEKTDRMGHPWEGGSRREWPTFRDDRRLRRGGGRERGVMGGRGATVRRCALQSMEAMRGAQGCGAISLEYPRGLAAKSEEEVPTAQYMRGWYLIYGVFRRMSEDLHVRCVVSNAQSLPHRAKSGGNGRIPHR